MTIRVMLVDDSAVVRQVLTAVFTQASGIEVADVARDPGRLAAIVAQFCETNPQVTVELSLNDRRADLIAEGFDHLQPRRDRAVRAGWRLRLRTDRQHHRRHRRCRDRKLAVSAARHFARRRHRRLDHRGDHRRNHLALHHQPRFFAIILFIFSILFSALYLSKILYIFEIVSNIGINEASPYSVKIISGSQYLI